MNAHTFVPSPQQSTIFDWAANGRGSAVVEAVAGAGKTTTLVEMLRVIKGDTAMVAYNKAIANELVERTAHLNKKGFRAGTAHSFGFGAVRWAYNGVKVDDKKLKTLFEMTSNDPTSGPTITAVTSMAKQVGIGALIPVDDHGAWVRMIDHYDLMPHDDDGGYLSYEEIIHLSRRLLKASMDSCHQVVDFDDMIYVPVARGLRMWKNDWVIVDEAQDSNAVRRALYRMMLKPGGRFVAVGDSRQAIYGFTGADADSMENITREFNCVRLPLTVTYRCPKRVVEVAHKWVSHIEAHPSAPAGEHQVIREEEFWAKSSELRPDDFVLCRNTRPLIEAAYKLIRLGVACRVEGRSIGEGLIRLTNRWKVKTVGKMLDRLENWKDRELAKAQARNDDARCDTIEDQFETVRVIASQFKDDDSLSDLHSHIYHLFSDEEDEKGRKPRLTLCTIHRSKGRERPRVFWFGSEKYSPSKWARQEHQLVQEANLCYVAATRAKETLIEVIVD